MVFIVTALSINAYAEHSICEDKCGDNVNYSFNPKTYELTISGKGEMTNYKIGKHDPPWKSYKDYIKSIIIENGVTCIGNYAFSGCINLTSVNIPNSVTRIGSLCTCLM